MLPTDASKEDIATLQQSETEGKIEEIFISFNINCFEGPYMLLGVPETLALHQMVGQATVLAGQLMQMLA